jgi:hypothetical protein
VRLNPKSSGQLLNHPMIAGLAAFLVGVVLFWLFSL